AYLRTPGQDQGQENLWFYDPPAERWQRRSRDEDGEGGRAWYAALDELRLGGRYDAEDGGSGRIAARPARVLLLRPGARARGGPATAPAIKLWVDEASHEVLARAELDAAGAVVRMAFYLDWQQASGRDGGPRYPAEVRIY